MTGTRRLLYRQLPIWEPMCYPQNERNTTAASPPTECGDGQGNGGNITAAIYIRKSGECGKDFRA